MMRTIMIVIVIMILMIGISCVMELLQNLIFSCSIMFFYVMYGKGNNLGIFDTVIEYIVFL